MIKYIVLLIVLFIIIYYFMSKYKIKVPVPNTEDSEDNSLSDNTKKLLDKSFKEHFD